MRAIRDQATLDIGSVTLTYLQIPVDPYGTPCMFE